VKTLQEMLDTVATITDRVDLSCPWRLDTEHDLSEWLLEVIVRPPDDISLAELQVLHRAHDVLSGTTPPAHRPHDELAVVRRSAGAGRRLSEAGTKRVREMGMETRDRVATSLNRVRGRPKHQHAELIAQQTGIPVRTVRYHLRALSSR
jgi:hypothetical protein